MDRIQSLSEAITEASQMSMAMAAARQRLHDAHFAFVLELIQKTRAQVPAPRALSIYARLHRLTEIDIQVLRHRVLVYLGELQSVGITELPNTFVAIDGEVEWDVTASLVERIRKRLTGRKLHELREWITLHSGHVEAELLRLHTDNVVAIADASGSIPRADVVRAYSREAGLGDRLNETLHNGLLAALYGRGVSGAPRKAAGAQETPDPARGGAHDVRRKGARLVAGIAPVKI
ncbi:MAG: hypothetical protein L0271_09010 [Gemmatimonadetes bacterium]|nr:hypothetical protein [Gemmatimonadota bacterium]